MTTEEEEEEKKFNWEKTKGEEKNGDYQGFFMGNRLRWRRLMNEGYFVVSSRNIAGSEG